MSAAIEVRQLTKRYGWVTAVEGLSFEVWPGRVTGFPGPNGAGKSTTMRAIVGLDRPTSGEVLVRGRRYDRLEQPKGCRWGWRSVSGWQRHYWVIRGCCCWTSRSTAWIRRGSGGSGR